MKKKSIGYILMFLLININLIYAFTKDDVPTMPYIQMPVGNELRGNISLLTMDNFTNYNYPKIRFNEDGDEKDEDNEWYVSVAFNTNRWLNNGCFSEPSENYKSYYDDNGAPKGADFHPGEDWNLCSGGDDDLGESVYSIGIGRVLYKGNYYGNTVIVVHKTTEAEYIKSIYAHLLKFGDIQEGQLIDQNTKIGEIGKDGCPGCGAHLHFEITKESLVTVNNKTNQIERPTSGEWPATMEGNTDNGYSFINKNYYNPSKFIKNYKSIKRLSWFFNNNLYTSWYINNCTTYQVNNNGWLYLQPESDPQIKSPYLSINPSNIDFIQFYARNKSNNSSGKIFIQTDKSTSYNETNSIDFTLQNDNLWHLIQINTHEIQGWDDADKIHGIRIDPIENGDGENDEIFIDYIRLRKKPVNNASNFVKWRPDGSLITTKYNSGVYIIDNMKKRFIPDSYFNEFNFDRCNVITVSEGEFLKYPEGEQLQKVSQYIIKHKDEGKCYLVNDEQRIQWIKNETIFKDIGWSFSNLQIVSDLDQYVKGPDITSIYPEGTLLKKEGDPTIYIISNGEARSFQSYEVYVDLGYSTDDLDNDGLWDAVLEVKELPANISCNPIESIYEDINQRICLPHLEYPLGNEFLYGGSIKEIKYSISTPETINKKRKSLKTSSDISKIVLSFTTDKYESEVILTSNAGNDSFQWNVPNVNTDGASVEITIYDQMGRPYSDRSKTFFSIEKNDNIVSEGKNFFEIFNDGAHELTINSISLENNSQWLKFSDDIPDSPFTIEKLKSRLIPVSIDKTKLSESNGTEIIHVKSNDPYNSDVTITVNYDNLSPEIPPKKPVDIKVDPSSWSKKQLYTITWQNPEHSAKISEVYYFIDEKPENISDGNMIYNSQSLPIPVFNDGEYYVYILLKDDLGNVDINNAAKVILYHDENPPIINDIEPYEDSINIPVDAAISFEVYDKHSGVNSNSLEMKINGTAVTPQILNELNESNKRIVFKYQPDQYYDFDNNIEVSITISDNSTPANYAEKIYSFRTFTENEDFDNDNISNSDEYKHGTNPINFDTDDDGLPDGWEIANQTDPNDKSGDNGAYGDIDKDGLLNIDEYLDGKEYSAEIAKITNHSSGLVTNKAVHFQVNGKGITDYKYKIDNGIWQEDQPIDNDIYVDNLSEETYTIYVIGKDQNGHYQSESSAYSLTWTLDLTPPDGIIEYSITQPTNQDVIAKLVNDSEILKIINNEGSSTKLFSENGSFTFEFEDQAGNSNESAASVTWIDKVPPTAKVIYSITQTTSQDVIATIIPSEPVEVINNEGSYTKTFQKNGEFLFELSDSAGNTCTVNSIVDWIEETEIAFPINYSANSNTTIRIPIQLNSLLTEIRGLDATIQYNSSVLSPLDKSATLENGDLDKDNYNYELIVNNKVPGIIRLALLSSNSKELYSKNGTIFFFEFNVIGNPGEITDLIFKNAFLNEKPLSLIHGKFKVKSPPVVQNIFLKTNEDCSANGQFIGSDVDGDSLEFYISSQPENGSVTITDYSTGSFVYEPFLNINDPDSFTYKAIDKSKAESNTAAVYISITPVNDQPIAISDKLSIDEDKLLKGQLKADDIDNDKLQYNIENHPENGSVVIDSQKGKFDFTPNENFNGADQFSFYVNDGKLKSNTATINIAIKAVNDQPVAIDNSFSIDEDKLLKGQLKADDIDNDKLQYNIENHPENGSVIIDSQTGKFDFTPNENFNGADQFNFYVNDGKLKSNIATINISIKSVNDQPVAIDDSFNIDEDKLLKGQLKAEDIENDKLQYNIDIKPENGSVVIDSQTGKFDFTPNENFNGSDQFSFYVNDGKLKSNTATIKISIKAVNDQPVAIDNSFSIDEDKLLKGQLKAEDIDNDKLQYNIENQPENGSIIIDSRTGMFDYTPNENFNGEDQFSFYVNDGKLKSNIATINISIIQVNDQPVAIDDSFSIDEDNLLKGQLKAEDIDNDKLKYNIDIKPENGRIIIDSLTGMFDYTPNKNFNGSDQFSFYVNDSKLKSNTAIIKININPVNDPPTISYIDDQITYKSMASNISFSVNDPDTPLYDLKLSYIVDEQVINSVTFDGKGEIRKAYILPVENQTGKTSITVQISDGEFSKNSSFDLNIKDVETGILSQEAYPEDHIFVQLELLSDTPIKNFKASIDYNNEILTPSKNCALLNGGILEDFDYSIKFNNDQKGIIELEINADSNPITGNGIIANLHFILDDYAPIGESAKLTITQAELNELPVMSSSGYVSITGFIISGTLNYYSSEEPVSNAIINVSGDIDYTTTTDNSGSYLIYGMRKGNYVLRPYKYDVNNDLAIKGLSSVDTSRIARYSIGLYDFNCYQRIASDVTMNGTTSSTDASNVGRYSLGLDYSPGLGQRLNDDDLQWVFLADPINSCDEYEEILWKSSKSIYLNSDRHNENFISIKLGDVDSSWTNVHQKKKSFSKRIQKEIYIENKNTLNIPLTLNQILQLEGLDIKIRYPDCLSFNDITFEDGGMLDIAKYKLIVNNKVKNHLSIMIFAKSSIANVDGIIAVLSFDVLKRENNNIISLLQFEGNGLRDIGGFALENDIVTDIKLKMRTNNK